MADIYPSSDFDEWAPTYDESVRSENGFPFEEYETVLKMILRLAPPEPGARVLDMGIGTGNLARLYADQGCSIWGLDFSAKMLEIAHSKIPGLVCGKADLRREWPPEFDLHFDRIVSAYTFHHFTLDEKRTLVQRILNESLAENGILVIGDIAFQDAAAQEASRVRLGSDWEQEEYWLADETISAFHAAGINCRFTPVSYCTGVFQFGTMVADG